MTDDEIQTIAKQTANKLGEEIGKFILFVAIAVLAIDWLTR